MVVLDTNVVIDYLIGKENIVKIVDSYAEDELSITFVNEYELLKHNRRRNLENAIRNLRVHHSSEAAALAAAKAYQSLKLSGKMVSDSDLLIFGLCVANNEILITQDKDFANLESESVLLIE